MASDIIISKDTVIDCLTQIIDSLQFIGSSLNHFKDGDIEDRFLDASELAGLCHSLHGVRLVAEDAYALHLQALRGTRLRLATSGNVVVFVGTTSVTPHHNPLITGTVQGTLSEAINSLQFLTTMLERIELNGDDRLLSPIEAAGLLNTINGIKAAADYCFEQCLVE